MALQTSQMNTDEVAKTLYVRLPRTIKNAKEIEDLFVGNMKVKLTRQSSRHCHVVFSSIEEKMKNLKNIKKIKMDGKSIRAFPARINAQEQRKMKEKKIKIPKPKPEPKMTKSLHISNIKPGTKAQEIKDAFPGCSSVLMFKSKNSGNKVAIIKLASVSLASEYLRKERQWPEVRGNILAVRPDTTKHRRGKKNKSSGLKIYDGKGEDNSESNKSEKSTASETKESESARQSEDEEDEEEEEESDSAESSEVEEE